MALRRFSLSVSAEVRQALFDNTPVVALESTIVTHGLPYPRNLEVAAACEATVRAGGAVPATCAVVSGVPTVGMSAAALEELARAEGVSKCSARELAFAAALGRHGSTTVAATLALAQLAGIRTFATGGIGGVHRGVSDTMDVSADLPALARAAGTVTVCAGVKSILDVPRTLEQLETLGVLVASLGVDAFPGFYSPSKAASPHRVETAAEAAAVSDAAVALGLPAGVLLACPNPDVANGAVIDAAVDEALREAAADPSVAGPAVTPFVLGRVAELTGGISVDSNRALVLNNCRVGAEVAVALAAAAGEAEAGR